MTYVFIHRWWTKKMMKDQGRFDQSTWDIRNQKTRTVMRWRMPHRGRRGCSGRELTTSTRFYCIELIDDGSFLCLTFTYEQNLIRIIYMVFVTQSINVPSYLPFDDAMAGSYSCIQCKNRCRRAIYYRQFRSYFPFFSSRSRYNN